MFLRIILILITISSFCINLYGQGFPKPQKTIKISPNKSVVTPQKKSVTKKAISTSEEINNLPVKLNAAPKISTSRLHRELILPLSVLEIDLSVTDIEDDKSGIPLKIEYVLLKDGEQLNSPTSMTYNGDPLKITNLSSGSYQIILRALDSEDATSTPLTFYINVKEPKIVHGPKEIVGNRISTSDEFISLKVISSDSHKNDVKWVWYSNSCGYGTPVYSGDTYRFKTRSSTKLYVRGEALNALPSDCIQVDIIIDDVSYKPQSIVINDGKGIFCENSTWSRKLKLKGGRLGLNAKWVWYKDQISSTTMIGQGIDEMEVYPEVDTRYYVRAEGPWGNTEAINFLVEVIPVPKPALSIKSVTELNSAYGLPCEGTPLHLSVISNNDSVENKWNWIWNSNVNGNVEEVGKGKSFDYLPVTSVKLSVFGKNECGVSSPVTLEQKILSKSISPVSIDAKPDNNKTTYSLMGGILGDNSQWKWFSDENQGIMIGEGQSITIKNKKSIKQVFVKAIGPCNETVSVSALASVPERRKMMFLNVGPSNISELNYNQSRLYDFFISLGFGKIYLKANVGLISTNGIKSSDLATIEYEGDNKSITNYPLNSGTYYEFSEIYYPKLNTYTAGLYGGFTKKGFAFNVYGGLGYGKYELLYGVKRYNYSNGALINSTFAKNINQSLSGPSFDAGMLIHIGLINVMGGINGIIPLSGGSPYISGHLGIGLSFTYK
jgi:hypothetical protein